MDTYVKITLPEGANMQTADAVRADMRMATGTFITERGNQRQQDINDAIEYGILDANNDGMVNGGDAVLRKF